jgi:glycosyltransferase involved in cell wall biosynthesis
MPPNEPLNFLIIGNHAPSLTNFRTPLMRQLVADGHKVTAVVPLNDLDERAAQTVRDALEQLGVDLIPVDLARTGLGPVRDLSYMLALRRVIARLRPDRIMAYAVKPAIYAGLACRTLGHPHFYPMLAGLGYAFTDGGGARKRMVRVMVSKLLKASFLGAHTVIFQNADDEALMRSEGILSPKTRSAIVSGSGVDRNHFAPAPLEKAPDEPTFLMVCRLMIDKGVREFAEAAAMVKKRHPHARFRLLGALDTANPASPDAGEIETWTAVDYLGSTDDVRPHLRACDAFVLPSFYREGIPRSALEALSIGRTIVTTDHPGCRETVADEENGLLVPVRDAAALAGAFEKLISEPQLFLLMGSKSLELARTRFDVEIVNRDMLTIMNMGVAVHAAN